MADRPLTTKQRLFVEAYLANPNATEAARKAGYSGDSNTLGQRGNELVRNSKIAALLEKRVEEAAMPANEVLQRLSEHARGSLGDLLDDDGCFDLAKARAEKKDHLLKKLKVRKNTTTDSNGNEYETTSYEYEIHDPQSALVHLGKHHRLFGADSASQDFAVRATDAAAFIRWAVSFANHPQTKRAHARGENISLAAAFELLETFAISEQDHQVYQEIRKQHLLEDGL